MDDDGLPRENDNNEDGDEYQPDEDRAADIMPDARVENITGHGVGAITHETSQDTLLEEMPSVTAAANKQSQSRNAQLSNINALKKSRNQATKLKGSHTYTHSNLQKHYEPYHSIFSDSKQ